MAEKTPEELEQEQKEKEEEEKRKQEEEEKKKKEEEEKNTEDVTKIAEKLAEEKLKSIKQKMDELNKKKEELEKENIKLKVAVDDGKKALVEKEGEHTKKLSEEKYELEKENSILKEKLENSERDMAVGEALVGLDFVNAFAKSQALAYMKTVVKRDDNDQWVHSSGVTLSDYVTKVLVKETDKSFWFKPKDTTGPNNEKTKAKTNTFNGKILDDKGSLSMGFDEMIKLASEGKLTLTGQE